MAIGTWKSLIHLKFVARNAKIVPTVTRNSRAITTQCFSPAELLNRSASRPLQVMMTDSFSRHFSKESSKKNKKKKQRNTADTGNTHPAFTQACIDSVRETKEEELWVEDRTPEQVEKDTYYYKEIQRRQMREARRVNKQLARKIRAKNAAFDALPEDMKKTCRIIDRQPFPYEVGPWVESPPIEGYDPTKFAQNSGSGKKG